MKVKNKISLSIFIILTSFVFASGQTEKDLKNYFEGRWVTLRMKMPATKDGVDIYLQKNPQIDSKDFANRLASFGVSIKNGDRMMITKIKVKGKHIEFQLGRGGYGTFGDDTGDVDFTPEPESKREKKLEKDLKNETDANRRREIKKDIRSEQQKREITDNVNRRQAEAEAESAKDRIAVERLTYGSRFNIRFGRKITMQDLTPQTIINALFGLVEF